MNPQHLCRPVFGAAGLLQRPLDRQRLQRLQIQRDGVRRIDRFLFGQVQVGGVDLAVSTQRRRSLPGDNAADARCPATNSFATVPTRRPSV